MLLGAVLVLATGCEQEDDSRDLLMRQERELQQQRVVLTQAINAQMAGRPYDKLTPVEQEQYKSLDLQRRSIDSSIHTVHEQLLTTWP